MGMVELVGVLFIVGIVAGGGRVREAVMVVVVLVVLVLVVRQALGGGRRRRRRGRKLGFVHCRQWSASSASRADGHRATLAEAQRR